MLTEAQLGSYEKEKIAKREAKIVLDRDYRQKIHPDYVPPQVSPLEDQLYRKLIIKAPFLLEDAETDRIAQIYLEHIAGVQITVDSQGCPDFPAGSLTKIGKRLNGIDDGGKAPENGVGFWQEVGKSIPELLTEEEVEWLVNNDPKGGGAFSLFSGIAIEGRSLLAMDAFEVIADWK